MGSLALFISVFLATAVESVEAVTIVLAAGTARDWKSALLGTGAALGTLVGIILFFGPSISSLPIELLQLFVGTLLLVFGLQWVRKAILRSSGYKSMHDEEVIFKAEIAAAREAKAGKKFGVSDWYGFTLSFKGVLLEGLEIAFIVLTFGTLQNKVGLASVSAISAVLIAAAAGFALRKPLARVPENKLKFIVGIMLVSFGIFWAAEGAGANWPSADAYLFLIIPFVTLISWVMVQLLKIRRSRPRTHQPTLDVIEIDEIDEAIIRGDRLGLKLVKDFALFWYDFLIGDDLIGTLIILIALQGTHNFANNGVNSWWLLPIAVTVLLPINLFRVIRSNEQLQI